MMKLWGLDLFISCLLLFIGIEPSWSDCSMKDIHVPFSVFRNCRTNITVSPGTEVEIACLSGYVLRHADGQLANITCQDDHWTAFPECLSACAPPNLPADVRPASIHPVDDDTTTLKPIYLRGDEILVLCENGYFAHVDRPRTHATITCQGRDRWSSTPVCHSHDRFRVAYLPHDVDLYHLRINRSLVLPCLLGANYSHHDITGWMWRLGQRDVFDDAQADPRLRIELDGTLNISNAHVEDEGTYTCLAQKGKRFIAGLVAYSVRAMGPPHGQPPRQSMLYLREGGSAVISCPYRKGNDRIEASVEAATLYFSWFLNGSRVAGDDKLTLLPNGELLIHEVVPDTRGVYRCEVSSPLWFTIDAFTIDVRINITEVESVCGIIGNENGSDSSGKRPWLSFLRRKREEKPFCYGSLIGTRWVLTTSFCLFGVHEVHSPDIVVAVGQNAEPLVPKGADYIPGWLPVESLLIHPDYIFTNKFYYNDIGLVKLRASVVFSPSVHPICLSDEDETAHLPYYNYPCDAADPLIAELHGYGSFHSGFGRKHLGPREENMSLLAPKQCWDFAKFTYSRNLLCAEAAEFPPVLAGDYGAPLEVRKRERSFLIGILSSSDRFPDRGRFDYFTKIADFYPWIKRVAFAQECND